MLTALAIVRSQVRKAVCFSNAYDCAEDFHLLEKYEDLFKGDYWMTFRDDGIMLELSGFIKGRIYPLSDELRIYDKLGNKIYYTLK